MTGLALFISVFLACAVEAVEATTIVLAAGTARDWKSSLMGTGSALGVLAIVIGVFGPSISHLPINSLRLFVGGLLLVFGLQWVRKAILRASGYKALHDEDAIFQEEIAAAKIANEGKKFGVHDWYSFTLSFKGVLLEGLEVAFIVLTFGTIQHRAGLASLAALAAVLVVVAAGVALRKPLARVPENQMKFIVGIMLTSFGIFWGAEGAGAEWPHKDLSLLAIIPFMVALSLLLIAVLKTQKARIHTSVGANGSLGSIKSSITNVADFDEADAEAIIEDRGFVKAIKDFGYFWYDFLIGDDLIGTLIVLASMEATNLAFHGGVNGWWILPLGVLLLLPINLLRVTR